MSKMLVEFTWDEKKLNRRWWNMDNMKACLFGEAHTGPDLLELRILEDHSLTEANDKLDRLMDCITPLAEGVDELEGVLSDMDDWLTDHYNPDGVPADIKTEYNKRLTESFNPCGWCGGNVFSKVPYKLEDGVSVPGDPIVYVDHQMGCVFNER